MTPILLLVVVSLLMVVAMVRFSAAIVERADSSAAVGWGVVYAGSWAAILSAASRVARDANDEPSTALLTLIVAAWGTFHAFWIWLVLGAASPARDTVRNTAGRLCLAGLAVLAFAAWQLVSAVCPRRRDPGMASVPWDG